MTTYLDRIVAAHRAAAAVDMRALEPLVSAARAAPATRGFRAAIDAAAAHELAVIAEIKRKSPSKGDLAPDLDSAALAKEYAAGGAACLSVLTDTDFFGGSADDLGAARDAADLPVLRKDFTVSMLDVADARLMGADALLLIVAALNEAELAVLHVLAGAVGLDVVVEVHDERELELALGVGATLVGVNQRDLVTFQVDPGRAVRMAPLIPDGVLRIAESGVTGADDARRLADAGYHAVLVGEHLVRSPDAAAAVMGLRVARP